MPPSGPGGPGGPTHAPSSSRRAGRYGPGMALAPGDKAPPITLVDQRGDKVKLSDFRGRKVLVFFYPQTLTTCHI